MVMKTKMAQVSKGLFFIMVCLIIGFLISFIWAQFTFKTKDATGTLQNRLVINQGAGIVDIDILNADLDMNSRYIKNVLNPVNPQDAATKSYVDSLVGGVAGVPPGAILLFPPNIACPAGYTDITSTYNDKVPLTCNGCTSITTGGTTSHSHTTLAHSHSGNTGSTAISHTHTVSGGWGGALHGTGGHGSGTYFCFGSNDPGAVSTGSGGPSHTHTIGSETVTVNSTTVYPPYFSVRICQKN